MAIFTTDDRDAVKTALIEAAVKGYSSVSVNGERIENASLDELERLLGVIQRDLLADEAATGSQAGLRIRQLKPAGCG